MATTLNDPIAVPRNDAHRRARPALRLLPYRFAINRWQGYRDQQMLRALRTIDHPGVLEDARIARGPTRR